MRVLLIEGHHRTGPELEVSLRCAGMVVSVTDDGEEGCDLASIYEYDAVVIGDNTGTDLRPDKVVLTLRDKKIAAPVLVVSGIDDVERKVRLLGRGADDYLVWPGSGDELIARLRAIIRRSKGIASNQVEVGPIALDFDKRLLTIKGERVHLTGKEYLMVELMALRRGAMVTKQAFFDHLYQGRDEPDFKIIDVYICKLRTKFAMFGASGHIVTHWGKGYSLSETQDVSQATNSGGGIPKSDSASGKILATLAHGPASASDIALASGVKLKTVRPELTTFKWKGMVVREDGHHTLARWHLTEKGRADLAARKANSAKGQAHAA